MSVHRAQISVFIGPLVPDGDAVILQVSDVGISRNKPQELVNDGFQVHLLGGEKGKAIGEIETHLVAENALRAGTGAVFLLCTVGADMSEEV